MILTLKVFFAVCDKIHRNLNELISQERLTDQSIMRIQGCHHIRHFAACIQLEIIFLCTQPKLLPLHTRALSDGCETVKKNAKRTLNKET